LRSVGDHDEESPNGAAKNEEKWDTESELKVNFKDFILLCSHHQKTFKV